MPIAALLAAWILFILQSLWWLLGLAVLVLLSLCLIPQKRRDERAQKGKDDALAERARGQRFQFGSPPTFRRDYGQLAEAFLGGGGFAIFLAYLILTDAPAGWPFALVILCIPAMVVGIWWDAEKDRERRQRREFYESVIEANRRGR